MRKFILSLALLAPVPALANFECTVIRQCGGGACEPFQGGPLLLEETGDVWLVTLGEFQWQGYATTTVDNGGLVSIVIPPLEGVSGLVSVYPDGTMAATFHSPHPEEVISITGTGNCQGVGG